MSFQLNITLVLFFRYDFSVKEGSIRGSIKLIENIKAKKKGKKSKNDQSDWTWRELSDLVKFTKVIL